MKKIKNYFYQLGWKAQRAVSLVVVVMANAFVLFTAHAQSNNGVSLTSIGDINSKVLCPIFNALFSIFMVVSVLMVLWAAFTYMRAQDDAEKVTQATKTITYAAVGIVVALIAKVFPDIIADIFSSSASTC